MKEYQKKILRDGERQRHTHTHTHWSSNHLTLVALIHSKSEVLIWYKVKAIVRTDRNSHCDTVKGLYLFLLYDLVSLFIYLCINLFLQHLNLSPSPISNDQVSFAVATSYSTISGAYKTPVCFLFVLRDCWSSCDSVHTACTLGPRMRDQPLSGTLLVLTAEGKEYTTLAFTASTQKLVMFPCLKKSYGQA